MIKPPSLLLLDVVFKLIFDFIVVGAFWVNGLYLIIVAELFDWSVIDKYKTLPSVVNPCK